jgi:alpha-galactosidase
VTVAEQLTKLAAVKTHPSENGAASTRALGPVVVENEAIRLSFSGGEKAFLTCQVKETGYEQALDGPLFEIDGRPVPARFAEIRVAEPATLPNGCSEYRVQGWFIDEPGLSLETIVRLAPDSPVARFHYRIHSAAGHTLTKTTGGDALTYLATSLAALPTTHEVRLAEFDRFVYSYVLDERQLGGRWFDGEQQVPGPILVASDGTHSLLLAYEHGAQLPETFVAYRLGEDRRVSLEAVMGNYPAGLSLGQGYRTLWFQLALTNQPVDGLAKTYRAFMLDHVASQPASREPFIFYNTWGAQERDKWWRGRTYLESMREAPILRQIEAAHRLGIEVFVIDAGWFAATGDWEVNQERFPNGLKPIKAKLDAYGMQLGLWFWPMQAATSSRALRDHPDCLLTRSDSTPPPRQIWETEESRRMCLVSRYGDTFAERVIALVREHGVGYLKWDGMTMATSGSFSCDAPRHGHGDDHHTPQQRAECYAFQLGLRLTEIAERITTACPGVVIDLDVTEPHRYVGLGFLSAGKFFLINNGPYYEDLDLPSPEHGWTNLYVHPGQARSWVCRTPLTYDKWVPSTLFLTHYLPDPPASSQMVNLASLVLGQNGLWGDLLDLSDDDIEHISGVLTRYKQVRADVAASSPVRFGDIARSLEMHEKLSHETGRGVVVAFATTPGSYRYITAGRPSPSYWASEGAAVAERADGRAVVELTFAEPGAAIVFFNDNEPGRGA